MKYNLNIHFSPSTSISFYNDLDDVVSIDLYLKETDNIEDLLSDKSFLKLIKKELDILKNDQEMYEETMKIVNKIIDSKESILDKCNSITLEFSDKTRKLIENNSFLQNADIVLDCTFEIKHEDLDLLLKELGDLKNVNLIVDGNDRLVTIEEYKKTVYAIDEMANLIKKYNLSPLEQMMFAYDLVRDRVYTKGDANDSYTISRDLTSVLLGDKIVCVGYANIYEKVLSSLGIKNMMYSIKSINSKEHGHRRNIAYVKDDKYAIEGVFYFDPTWDSKKNDCDISYLDSYKFFCLPKEDIEIYTKGKFVDRTFNGYSDSLCWEFEDIVSEDGIEQVPSAMIRTINEVSEFVDDKKIINPMLLSRNPMLIKMAKDNFDLDDIMDYLTRYRSLFFDQDLSADVMMKIIFNVRKVEYIENPEKYPLDIDTLKRIMVLTDNDIARRNLLTAIYGNSSVGRRMTEESFNEEINAQELPLKIERIKLVKVLQKTLSNKQK